MTRIWQLRTPDDVPAHVDDDRRCLTVVDRNASIAHTDSPIAVGW
jgi:hypothetical protein